MPAAHLAGEKETERCLAIYVLSFRALALSTYGQHSGGAFKGSGRSLSLPRVMRFCVEPASC